MKLASCYKLVSCFSIIYWSDLILKTQFGDKQFILPNLLKLIFRCFWWIFTAMYSVCTTVCTLNIISSSSLYACKQGYLCRTVLSVILWVLLFAMLHFSFSQLKSVLTIYYKQKHVIAFTRHMTKIKSSTIFLKWYSQICLKSSLNTSWVVNKSVGEIRKWKKVLQRICKEE